MTCTLSLFFLLQISCKCVNNVDGYTSIIYIKKNEVEKVHCRLVFWYQWITLIRLAVRFWFEILHVFILKLISSLIWWTEFLFKLTEKSGIFLDKQNLFAPPHSRTNTHTAQKQISKKINKLKLFCNENKERVHILLS